MNPGEIIYIKNRIAFLGESIEDISKVIAALKIDRQLVLSSNKIIPPGVACRVTYDSKGLIIKGEDLRIEDIPELPIEKITGLKKILESKFESSAVAVKEQVVTRTKIKAGTGTKVNYDDDGYITSSADLLESDIPDLSISKIVGLEDRLNFISSQIGNISKEEIVEEIITPGTFPKITYDKYGRVIKGSKLSMDDIPMDLITKMNIIEDRIPLLASQQTVEALMQNVEGKVNSNGSINPGTYTKVNVDEQGLVTLGSTLTMRDLPEIRIKDITGLERALRGKAEQSDLVQLMNSVSSLVDNNRPSELIGIQNELSSKVSEGDLRVVANKVDGIQRLIDTLVEKLPGELIIDQLNQIQKEISSLTGRINAIEQQLKIPV